MAVAAKYAQLSDINMRILNDAEAAAYSWLLNRLWFQELRSMSYGRRVIALDGEELAASPAKALPPVLNLCGPQLLGVNIRELVEHPSVHRHSKNPDESYDCESRRDDMAELNDRFGMEADAAVEWALELGFPYSMLACPQHV